VLVGPFCPLHRSLVVYMYVSFYRRCRCERWPGRGEEWNAGGAFRTYFFDVFLNASPVAVFV